MSTHPDSRDQDSGLTPLLLTAREAAAMLSISPRTLWSLTQADEVRSVRIGRSVRYTFVDLKEFIARRSDAKS